MNEATFTIHGADFSTRDGTCVRDYLHVTDLARAHVRAADRMLSGGGCFVANLGTGNGVTVREIADAVEKVSGRPLSRLMGPRRVGDPPVLIASTKKARELLDWTAVESTPSKIVESAWMWALKEESRRRSKAAIDPLALA